MTWQDVRRQETELLHEYALQHFLRRRTLLLKHAAADFMMGGTAAAISKTVAAPIERVKILMQNQGSMITAGRLDRPYSGIIDCFSRTYQNEGMLSCK